MNKLRLIATLSTPGLLGRGLYKSAYGCLKATLALTHPAVDLHVRNSFLTNAFTPFLSDLDLSIVFPDNYDPESTKSAVRKIRACKKIFPMLTEQNTYSNHEIEKYLDLLNPLEAERDPYLKKYIKREETIWEKLAFLLRAYASDFKNLLENPVMRQQKWAAHSERTGIRIYPPYHIENVLERSLETIFQGKDLLMHKQNTLDYFNKNYAGEEKNDTLLNHSICAFYPHIFAFREDFIFEQWMVPIIEAQLNWELWGVSCQWRQALVDPELRQGIDTHLEHLIRRFPDYKNRKELIEIKKQIVSE